METFVSAQPPSDVREKGEMQDVESEDLLSMTESESRKLHGSSPFMTHLLNEIRNKESLPV